MRRARSRNLGLTREEYVEITDEEPDFVDIVQRDSNVNNHVNKLLRRAQQIAEQVLKDAGLPAEIPEALYLDEERLPPNAALARRILSNITNSPLFLQSENQIRSFIAGFELAEWQRLLLTNLEFQADVEGREKQKGKLPDARRKSADKRRKITPELLNATENLKPQKIRAAALGVSVAALKKALAKQN